MRVMCVVALLACWAAPQAEAQEGNARAEALARTSPTATAAMAALREKARALHDRKLREAALALLDNPAPSFMARYPDAAAREEVRTQLVQAGWLDADVTVGQLFPPLADPARAPQAFVGAPAQGLHGHHGYPGGLAEHTVFDLRSALALAADYRATSGLSATDLQDDWLVAATLLHDAMKPWCLQWRADGTLTVQAKIAGTASHHVFVIAEAFHRGLPPQLLVTLASAHETPLGDGAPRVVAFLRAGALLAGVDPVALGVLAPGEGGALVLRDPPPIEASITFLADHDWVLTDPTARVVDDALDRLARAAAGGATPPDETQLRWMRHRVQAQVPSVRLYAVWRAGGDDAVRAALAARKVPLLTPDDARR